jgi:phosphoribosylglycinamide formyltransferase-1
MNKKWALFFSGQGSILKAVLNKYYKTWATPPVVITNNPKAAGLKVAASFGLNPILLNFNENNPYAELQKFLEHEKVERIFLLGFLKILPAEFITCWQGRIFNLHPSLLPKYPGLKSIERAYAEKQDIGVSIHRVTEGVDEGEILVQKLVLNAKDYDPLSLDEVKALVHSKEHEMVCDFILQGDTHLGSKI